VQLEAAAEQLRLSQLDIAFLEQILIDKDSQLRQANLGIDVWS
jgi:hypothetical protein